MQEKTDVPTPPRLRLASEDQEDHAADAALAEEQSADAEWEQLVRRARSRATAGFDAGEITAKDAVAIILADARIRERTKKPDDDPLNDMRDAFANALGIKRDHKTVALGEADARKKRTGRR